MTDEEKEKSLSYYRSLHIAAIKGDWASASEFIQENPDAVRASITIQSETALHVAIRLVHKNHFVMKLVQKMSEQDLALRDESGLTALHVAAEVDNIEAAKLLVEKNPNLPNISMDDGAEELPLHLAAEQGNREMVSYLWDATRLDVEDKSGAKLLCALTYGELYDFALILLQRYPELACMEGDYNPSMIIVEKRSSFRSGASLNPVVNLIYSNVPMKLENIADQHSGHREDIENLVGCFTFRWTYVRRFSENLMHWETMACIWLHVWNLNNNSVSERLYQVQLYKCSENCNGLRMWKILYYLEAKMQKTTME